MSRSKQLKIGGLSNKRACSWSPFQLYQLPKIHLLAHTASTSNSGLKLYHIETVQMQSIKWKFFALQGNTSWPNWNEIVKSPGEINRHTFTEEHIENSKSGAPRKSTSVDAHEPFHHQHNRLGAMFHLCKWRNKCYNKHTT